MSKSLNDLEIYREASRLGEIVWGLVTKWDRLAQDTVGKQFVRSTESTAANLAEGYGRYHFKENLKFYCYSRGSLAETQTLLEKAAARDLIDKDQGRQLYRELGTLRKRLNTYIKTIGSQSSHDS